MVEEYKEGGMERGDGKEEEVKDVEIEVKGTHVVVVNVVVSGLLSLFSLYYCYYYHTYFHLYCCFHYHYYSY